MPNIIAIFSGKKRELGGCEIYRTTMPLYYMSEKYPEWKTSWAFYEDLHEDAKKSGDSNRYWWNLANRNDIFIFPRVYFKQEESIREFNNLIYGLHQLGKRVVYEVDDDMTNEYRQVVEGDAIEAARQCDAITTSTPYLANLMEERTGKKTYTLPNMISPEIWFSPFTGTFKYQGKVVLGLTGSTTHKDDWLVLKDVLPDIVRSDKIHLILMGYHPDYLKDLPNTSYLPGLPYAQYAQVIQTCDIVLAPINRDQFNLSKSSIKIIEGMAARRKIGNQFAGAAGIASNHLIYQSAIKNEKTGLLVDHTIDGWKAGLNRLIYDEPFRHNIQIAGHEWVQRHHDITKKSILWANAFEAIIKRKL